MELEQDAYDVVVIGTGLAESIAAAALAKAGKSVLHLDPNEYYGGEQASLTLDELQAWSNARTASTPLAESSSAAYTRNQQERYTRATTSEPDAQLLANRRRYALSLFPAVLPSRGPLITTLINSGVSKYVSFRMLDSVSLWDQGAVRRVPGSKEQVFKDKDISLQEKRKLMKFLMFAVREFEDDSLVKGKEAQPFLTFLQESFSLPSHLATQVAFAISHCSSTHDPTIQCLRRTSRYLKSIGRYGSGAFLIGQYGGAGEIAQGFCRACAVFGGTYVLGPDSIPETFEVTDTIKLKIPCHPRAITAKHLITSPDHLPSDLAPSRSRTQHTAQCIAIVADLPEALRRPEAETDGQDDTAIVIFPDSGGNVVRAMVMGEGTGSCPSGRFVLYLSRELSGDEDPKPVLQPYLHRLSPSPLFEAYYSASHTEPSTPSPSPAIVLLNPYSGSETMTEGLDWEAEQGEAAFWTVMGARDAVEEGKGFFDKTEEEAEDPDDL